MVAIINGVNLHEEIKIFWLSLIIVKIHCVQLKLIRFLQQCSFLTIVLPVERMAQHISYSGRLMVCV